MRGDHRMLDIARTANAASPQTIASTSAASPRPRGEALSRWLISRDQRRDEYGSSQALVVQRQASRRRWMKYPVATYKQRPLMEAGHRAAPLVGMPLAKELLGALDWGCLVAAAAAAAAKSRRDVVCQTHHVLHHSPRCYPRSSRRKRRLTGSALANRAVSLGAASATTTRRADQRGPTRARSSGRAVASHLHPKVRRMSTFAGIEMRYHDPATASSARSDREPGVCLILKLQQATLWSMSVVHWEMNVLPPPGTRCRTADLFASSRVFTPATHVGRRPGLYPPVITPHW